MVRWVKRLASIANSIFLFAFFLYGHPGIAIIGGIINLVWTFDEKLASRIRRLLRSWALMVNTAFLAYGVLRGGPSILALFLAGSSLLAWNAGLFLERWNLSDPPLIIQYQYLRRIGILSALGLLAGFSALALRGRLTLLFLPALLLMLAAGILWLRIISEALKNRNHG
jgi:hypothetical protein